MVMFKLTPMMLLEIFRRREMRSSILFILIGFLKTPEIFIHPRFWAEEGAIFYRDIQGHSVFFAITYLYDNSILLPTSIAVWIATKVPLILAPDVTTAIAFTVQIGVAGLIGLWAKFEDLSDFVTALLVICWAFLPATYEIWASATNLQWTFSIAALLVLLMPPEVRC